MIGAGPLKNAAQNLGFLQCGVSKATFLEEEAPRLERWLQQGNQGEMHYLENHFDKRLDPRLLVPGAQSVISLSFHLPKNGPTEHSKLPVMLMEKTITSFLKKNSPNW